MTAERSSSSYNRGPALGRARSMKPVVTRIENRHLTVAAQAQRGIRLDIAHIRAGGDELHVEAYDYHGRKIEVVAIERGSPGRHPEVVFRLVADPQEDVT